LECAPPSRTKWTKRKRGPEGVGEGAEPNLEHSRDCTCAPPSSPRLLRCKLSGPRWVWGASQVTQRGPHRRRANAGLCHPPPGPCQCHQSHPRGRESPAPGKGAKGMLRARTWSPSPAARATLPLRALGCGHREGCRGAALTQTGPGSSSRWPRTLGREAACRAAGALPLWRGADRLRGLGPPRVLGRRRRRSCASSCSGAPAVSSPLRAQGQSPRSLQTPKRESESPGCGRAAAEAGAGARSLAPGGCCSCRCRCSGLNLPSRSRRANAAAAAAAAARSHSRAVAGTAPPAGMVRARPAAPRPSHLRLGRGARLAAEGREGAAAWGRGRDRASLPGLPPLSGRSIFRSASLCLWFHFLFPDHDSNTIEGNHI
jgi:hypothetical protein